MIKVGYVLSSTLAQGGATLSFRTLLQQLRKQGVEPFVVVPDHDGFYAWLQAEGIPTLVVSFRLQTYTYLRTPKDIPLFIPRMAARLVLRHRACRKVARWFRENKVQLVHTNVGMLDIGYQAARRIGLPHVYHLREYGDRDFGMRYFPNRKAQIRLFDRSYTISITRDIQRYHRQEGRKEARVIYNGIFPRRDALPETHREDFLLYAGRVEAAKDVDWMLQAYQLYARQSAQPLPLKIAGKVLRADYLGMLRRFVAQNGLEDLVEFMGERTDLPEIMQKARAIIVPSHAEGFGRCMPEAMFNGCLAIGRDTAGTKEQMDNGLELCGEEIALRFGTQEELARQLSAVERQPDGFADHIRRAFYTVNHLYCAETSAQQVLDLYRSILKAQGQPTQKH